MNDLIILGSSNRYDAYRAMSVHMSSIVSIATTIQQ